MKLREKTNIQICEENNLKHTFLLNVVEETTTKNKNYTMEEFISRIIDFMKSEYGDFLMIVMCLVFVVFIVTIFNNKTPE